MINVTRYVQRCDRGTYILGVTNICLIELKAHTNKVEFMCGTVNVVTTLGL